MAKLIHGNNVQKALIALGIATEETRRVIIDIPTHGFPVIYLEQYGDERLLELVAGLTASEIRGVPRDGASKTEDEPGTDFNSSPSPSQH